ncbi:MAG: hypothetical protein IJY37_09695 [Clostridia bacterium]|nr:hypothetical protein [Clostridia bacterium]
MNTNSVKKYAKIAVIVVAAVLVFALLCFGLSKLLDVSFSKGQIIAEYDGESVYDADVQDIINYNLITKYDSTTTEAGLNQIMQEAVVTYVRYRAMEIDLAKKGYTIDEDELDKTFKEAKKEIEKTQKYSEWCEMHRVSKDFLKDELRRYALAALYNDVIESDVKVTEAEAREYYALNAISKYKLPAGYYWTATLRPVKNIADQTETTQAKAEMQAYLEKIKNGEMTFEDVDKELNAKYPASEYPSAIYDGEDSTAIDTMYQFIDEKDFQDLLTTIDTTYKDRDLNADPKSEAYNNYMSYLGATFEAKVHYALKNMEVGDVWAEPFESFVGYYIIRLDRIETQNAFVPYEEVSGTIIESLMAEKLQNEFLEYMVDLETKYKISYNF